MKCNKDCYQTSLRPYRQDRPSLQGLRDRVLLVAARSGRQGVNRWDHERRALQARAWTRSP